MLSPWRLRVYPTAVLLAVGTVFLYQLVRADGADLPGGGRLGGDLPAFVGAARQLRAGAPLYDPAAQLAAQAGLVPEGTFLRFAWPPAVAALHLPLTALPWPVAVGLHGVALTGVAALGLARAARAWGLPPALAVPAGLSFYPLLRADLGGQLTGLLVALLACVWAGPRWLGGLLALKPGVALPALVRPAALPGVVLAWAACAAVDGVDWTGRWWPAARAFVAAARGDRGGVSFWDHPPVVAAFGGALLVAAALRLRRDPDGRVALAACAGPLLAPHALYYDVGLVVLPLGLVAARAGRRALPALLAVWGAGLGMIVAPGPVGTGVLLATAGLLMGVARPAGRIGRGA